MKSISKKQNQLEKKETFKSAKIKGILTASIISLSGEECSVKISIPKGICTDIIHFDFSNFFKQSKNIERYKMDYYTVEENKLINAYDWSEKILFENFNNVYALNFESFSSERLDFSKQNLLKYTLNFLN